MSDLAKRRLIDVAVTAAFVLTLTLLTEKWWMPFALFAHAMWNFYDGMTRRDLQAERQRSAASNTGATMSDEVDEMSAASRGSGANHSAFPNSWIPVSERLPEHDSNVLVAAKRDGEYVVKEMLFVDWSDNPDPPRPEWSDDWGGEKFENVTHWMPLPAPPSDGK